jgi:hypothetical protein
VYSDWGALGWLDEVTSPRGGDMRLSQQDRPAAPATRRRSIQAYLMDDGVELVVKPFTFAALAAKICKVLDNNVMPVAGE